MKRAVRNTRNILMTAVVGALLASPAGAEPPANCWYTPQHYGLFCNDGSDIYICEGLQGCTAQCGDNEEVEVSC